MHLLNIICTHCSYLAIIRCKCLWKNQSSLYFDKYRSNYSISFIFTITFIVKIISIVNNCLWLFIRLYIAAWEVSLHISVQWSPLAMHLHCGPLQTSVHEQDINSSTASRAGRPCIWSIARSVASPLSWMHPFPIGLGISALFQTAVW